MDALDVVFAGLAVLSFIGLAAGLIAKAVADQEPPWDN